MSIRKAQGWKYEKRLHWQWRKVDMKPAFFRSPSDEAKPRVAGGEAVSLDVLRQRILSSILVVALIFGFLAFLASLPGRIQQQEWGVIVGFLAALGWILALMLLPRLGYRVRALSLVLAIALVGMITLLADGLYGSARVYLMAVPIATGLVLSIQGSILALIATLLVFLITGLMMVGGILPAPLLAPGSENSSLGGWLVATASLALVGTTITVSLASILRGLESSVRQEKRLSMELDAERAQLEHRVLQRTQDLERRLTHIRAASEIIRSIGTYLNAEQLLPRVASLIQERFNLYYAGVYLLNEEGELQLVAGTGEAGEAMLAADSQSIADENSSVSWVIKNKKARIALDVGYDAVRFNNSYLPLTRSELALPLIGGRGLLGALTAQSSEAKAFDHDDITVLQGIADALATALENARLFQELEQSLNVIQTLHRQFLLEAWRNVAQKDELRQISVEGKNYSPSESLNPIQVPLVLRNQEIGKLTLEMDRPDLTLEEQAFVDAVATQASVALENVRLLEMNRRQAGYERLLSDISRKARSSTDMATILRTTLKEIGQVLGAADGVIQLAITSDQEEYLVRQPDHEKQDEVRT
jgi:GAF domain-containing protein